MATLSHPQIPAQTGTRRATKCNREWQIWSTVVSAGFLQTFTPFHHSCKASLCVLTPRLPAAHSPGEDSFRPIRSLALWILSRHMACSFLKMQSECIAIACRIWGTDDEGKEPTDSPCASTQERSVRDGCGRRVSDQHLLCYRYHEGYPQTPTQCGSPAGPQASVSML